MEITIELPEEFKPYFEYIKLNFGLDFKTYIKDIIKEEVLSRNNDLKIF